MSLFGCLRSGSYFRFSTAGAAAFGLANALDTVPGGGAAFFLSALGFLASRLVLFWPFAIAVLPSEGCREPLCRRATRRPPIGTAPRSLACAEPSRSGSVRDVSDRLPRQRLQVLRRPDQHAAATQADDAAVAPGAELAV